MSTLTVSIVALVVFVVGAVVMFNLWQGRGSRWPGRNRDRAPDDQGKERERTGMGRGLSGVQPRRARAARSP